MLTFTVLTACGAKKQAETAGMENAGHGNTGDITSVGNVDDQIASGSGISKDKEIDGSKDENGEIDGKNDTEYNQVYDESKQELLQSASIDLDNDGANEQIKAIRLGLPGDMPDASGGTEGRLVITDGDSEKQIIFRGKDDEWTQLLTSIQFEDLDGDGAKDVFIIIPGYGASFNYSDYFMYSYKKDKSYAFSSDNTLADFIGSFEFSYSDGNKLALANRQYGFATELSIEDAGDGEQMAETMRSYVENTWIDPVSVDISEDSRLALVKNNGRPEIKVPLPVFGMATVNMIGEIDLYYHVDDDFEPVLKRCEVVDFSGEKRIRTGTFELN